MIKALFLAWLALSLGIIVPSVLQSQIIPQEKIYTHLDRDHYTIGDRIYYKVYLADENNSPASARSRVVYVDLLRSDEMLLQSQILQIRDGSAWGDFDIAYDSPDGIYTLRFYTEYLLNFTPPAWYEREIQIHGLSKSDQAREIVDTGGVTIDFYPEGGSLVAGNKNVIAIKATNQLGRGVSIIGEILDASAKAITSFETDSYGFGQVTVDLSKSMIESEMLIGKVDDLLFDGPKISGEGCVLTTFTDDDQHLSLRIVSSANYNLAGHKISCRRQGKLLEERNIEQRDTMLTWSWESLPPGILVFTLSDAQDRAVSEILGFNYFGIDNYNVDLTFDRDIYQPRDLIKLTMDVFDDEGDALSPSLSLSVVDHRYLTNASCDNINTYFWLGAEIKGHVENPCQYFDGDLGVCKANIRGLLLTQGWRKYSWLDATHQVIPEQNLSLVGQVIKWGSKSDGQLAQGILSQLSGDLSTKSFVTDQNGFFEIPNLDYFGPTNFILQAQKYRPGQELLMDDDKMMLDGNRNVDIIVQDRSVPGLIHPDRIHLSQARLLFDFKEDNRLTIERAEANWDGLSRELPEVQVTADRIEHPVVEYYQPSMLYERPDQRIMLLGEQAPERYAGINGVFNIIRSRVFGAQVTRLPNPMGSDEDPSGLTANAPKVILRGASSLHSSTAHNDGASIMINGSMVPSNALLSLSPERVAFIDVISSAHQLTLYGETGSGGIISVYLKPPGVKSQITNRQKGILSFTNEGYYQAREFFVPRHDQLTSHPLDDRVTLFWDPNVSTVDGEAKVEFHASDRTSKYEVIMQGLTKKGLPIFYHTSIRIE